MLQGRVTTEGMQMQRKGTQAEQSTHSGIRVLGFVKCHMAETPYAAGKTGSCLHLPKARQLTP